MRSRDNRSSSTKIESHRKIQEFPAVPIHAAQKEWDRQGYSFVLSPISAVNKSPPVRAKIQSSQCAAGQNGGASISVREHDPPCMVEYTL